MYGLPTEITEAPPPLQRGELDPASPFGTSIVSRPGQESLNVGSGAVRSSSRPHQLAQSTSIAALECGPSTGIDFPLGRPSAASSVGRTQPRHRTLM
jgi:hypothetical protein